MSTNVPGIPPSTGASPDAPGMEQHKLNRGKSKEEIQAGLAGVNQVQFRPEHAQMPTQLYVHGEDVITAYVTQFGSVAQPTMIIRFLRMDGTITPMRFPLQHGAGATNISTPVILPEGFILGISVFQEGSPLPRGQCYVCVVLNRVGLSTLSSSQVLMARYLETIPTLGWPYPSIQGPFEGPGGFLTILGATPAAGAEIIETIPTHLSWKIMGWKHTLTTGAALGARGTVLQIRDNNNAFMGEFPWASPVGPGVAQLQVANLNTFVVTPVPNPGDYTLLPQEIIIPAGGSIRTVTTNLAAADQYSAPSYCVQQWLQP